MHKRLNITLPEGTLHLLDRVASAGNRSLLIDRAVRHYIKTIGRTRIRRLLREEALERREEDLAIASEWFPTS